VKHVCYEAPHILQNPKMQLVNSWRRLMYVLLHHLFLKVLFRYRCPESVKFGGQIHS